MKVHATYSDLPGRRALVTGASSGIGLGVAEALLEQGMHVAVHYRSNRAAAEALCARFPGRGFPVQAELGTEAGCAHAVAHCHNLAHEDHAKRAGSPSPPAARSSADHSSPRSPVPSSG